MSDQRLRTLERAWYEAGTVSAESDYLQAQVRAGDLPGERLELAAYLEHPVAYVAVHGILPKSQRRRAVLEGIVRQYEEERPRIAKQAHLRLAGCGGWVGEHSPREALRGLAAFGKEACVRAILYGTRMCFGSPPTDTPYAAIMDACEDWIVCPCTEHVRWVRRTSVAQSN